MSFTWLRFFSRITTATNCWEPAIQRGEIVVQGGGESPGEILRVCRSAGDLRHVLDGVPHGGFWVTARFQDGQFESATGEEVAGLVARFEAFGQRGAVGAAA